MSENWLNLNEKVYIVTGGSSGIGEAIVKELLNDGAYVYDADLQPAKEEHDHLTFVETDVTNKGQVDALVARVVEEHGHVDGVINNAGINLPRLLVDAKESNSKYELTENDFDKMFNVNVKSVFLMSQAVARQLVKQKSGVIVNMASEAGLKVHKDKAFIQELKQQS